MHGGIAAALFSLPMAIGRWNQVPALDTDYLGRLGKFDIVYSWGVLHHTGAMWDALANVAPLVQERGKFLIHRDLQRSGQNQPPLARGKAHLQSASPRLRFLVLGPACWHLWWRRILTGFFAGETFFIPGAKQKRLRGMSAWRDVVDWVGGYPFEVAKPDQIFDFFSGERFRSHAFEN